MKRALVILVILAGLLPQRAIAVNPESALLVQQETNGSRTLQIAVVPVNFKGYRKKPTTQARIGNAFFNSPDVDGHTESLASYWNQSSYGAELIDGVVLPLTPLPAFKTCDFDGGERWIKDVKTYWNQRGTNLDQYDHVFLIIPRINCEYGGYAVTPGKWVVINWSEAFWKNVRTKPSIIYILAHELLHNKGFGHSGVISCINNKRKVSLGGNCNEQDRFATALDPFDIITGSGYLPKLLPTAFQRITLGFITDDERVHLTQSGTFQITLNPIEFPNSQTKALVVRRLGLNQYVTPTYEDDSMTSAGAPDICIEWHQPRGWFNDFAPRSSIVRGISMRLCDLYSGGVEYLLEEGGSETGFYQAGTRLIDATPGSKAGKADWTDAQLTKGTWTDEFTGITIRVVGFNKTGTDRSQWSINLEVVIP